MDGQEVIRWRICSRDPHLTQRMLSTADSPKSANYYPKQTLLFFQRFFLPWIQTTQRNVDFFCGVQQFLHSKSVYREACKYCAEQICELERVDGEGKSHAALRTLCYRCLVIRRLHWRKLISCSSIKHLTVRNWVFASGVYYFFANC